jgi:hypothetical protein
MEDLKSLYYFRRETVKEEDTEKLIDERRAAG